MTTVNFSIPDEVTKAFDVAFSGKNKSAVIARLMVRATEEQQRRQRRAKAVDALLDLRARAPTVTDEQIHATREQGRP